MPNLRFAAFLLTSVLAALAQAEPLPVLRLCYELEGLPPYINTAEADRDLPQPGLVLELIEQAARQAQVRVQTHRQPWKRCLHELQAGTSDGAFVAIWLAERDAWGRFPGRDPQRQLAADPRYRLWRVDYPIIVRKGSALQWDGQHFSGVRQGVGAPLGYAASQRLRELGVLASESLAPAKALKLVAAGRLDGYVLEREIGLALLERQALGGQLMFLPKPLLETDWYLPLSHQFYAAHPELAEGFWQALAEQRERHGADLARRYLRQPPP